MATSKTPKPPKNAQDALLPVDWSGIEPHFRAGLRSIASIAREFGVTRRAIDKHAAKARWIRNLAPAIHERAAQLVAATPELPVAASGSSPAQTATDAEIIEVNAQALAIVQHAHRTLAKTQRELGTSLLRELVATTDTPELFARAIDLVELGEELDAADKALIRKLIELCGDLPRRAGVFKTLVESMAKVQGMEREAFGLNTDESTGGNRFTVIVKDYTGKGDKDAPPKPEGDGDED